MYRTAESHLGVEAAGGLQKQRQVGLDLAAVGVGSVLGLALQGGDLVLESMIPPAGRQKASWLLSNTDSVKSSPL